MTTKNQPTLQGKRAVILTADEFEDMELFFPMFRLLEEGVDVTVAAPQKGPATSDTYALAGFPKALALIDKACGVKR